jgi:hypothetical protein
VDNPFAMLLMVGAILCWFVFVLFILRWMAGTRRRLEFDPGKPLRWSIFGCGRINDVNFGYCSLQIVEYPKGWLIVVLPSWFFGVKWFPKEETVIGPVEQATWYRTRLLTSGSDTLVLVGLLTDFVSQPTEGKIEPKAP